MTTHLTPYEEKILEKLHPKWGALTADIREECGHVAGGVSRASQSALVMQSLKRLEKRGLVKRLDGELPIAWVLAKEGGTE
jgi:hypothetical protein